MLDFFITEIRNDISDVFIFINRFLWSVLCNNAAYRASTLSLSLYSHLLCDNLIFLSLFQIIIIFILQYILLNICQLFHMILFGILSILNLKLFFILRFNFFINAVGTKYTKYFYGVNLLLNDDLFVFFNSIFIRFGL